MEVIVTLYSLCRFRQQYCLFDIAVFDKTIADLFGLHLLSPYLRHLPMRGNNTRSNPERTESIPDGSDGHCRVQNRNWREGQVLRPLSHQR